MTKLPIIVGLVILLLSFGYGSPPDVRRATNSQLATLETATEAMIDNIPSPSPATWQAIGDPWAEDDPGGHQ